MKMKHIIALCLVLTILLPSTAFAATSSTTASPKLSIKVVTSGKTATASYTYSGPKEYYRTWNFGDGFTCHCTTRSHTYAKHGTYKVSLTLYTKDKHTYTTYKYIKV
jgi:PKD repeat protein